MYCIRPVQRPAVPVSKSADIGEEDYNTYPEDHKVSLPTSGVVINLKIVVPGGCSSYVTSEWNNSARENAYGSGRELRSL
jgi:hypothetical protein